MATTNEPSQLAAELVRHGLIIPVGADGAFGRGTEFEGILEAFDQLITRAAVQDGYASMTFPPVINRGVLERIRYLDAFPHLCGAVYALEEPAASGEQKTKTNDWDALARKTDLVLNPAACYPLYPTLTGTLHAAGQSVTMLNWVFRNEPSPQPTRLRSFRVREFVRVGTQDQVLQWRDIWLRRSTSLLQSLGLDVTADVASDPFFGADAAALAASQKQRQLKFELSMPLVPGTEPTALCSFNFHQAFFGLNFEIRSSDGRIAHSACVGFGLERLVMALFSTHGFDSRSWSRSVREQLRLG